MPAATRHCSRCRQALPEGSGYCVGCGCHNEGSAAEKMIEIDGKNQKRREWLAIWMMLTRIFPFLRLFR